MIRKNNLLCKHSIKIELPTLQKTLKINFFICIGITFLYLKLFSKLIREITKIKHFTQQKDLQHS